MIRLAPVDENNFRKVIDMKLPPEPEFVAPNVVSLAQAWLRYSYARPFAICNDDDAVGFIMLFWNETKRFVSVWRMMIAQEHQGKEMC